MRRRTKPAAVTIAGCLALALALTGGAVAPQPHPARLCIPIILPCPEPSPTPSAPSTQAPILPGIPAIPGLPGTPTDPDSGSDSAATGGTVPAPLADAVFDAEAPLFTQPPAQLGSRSLSFTGLKGVEPVTVALADGSRVSALKLSADSITIEGFALTVRHETGPSLATTADTMTLRGNVHVWVNSLTASTPGGGALTLGADTPAPRDGIEPLLVRVTLGLVGATADSIEYSHTDQQMSP
ncbi:hypothetical protein AB1K54_14230 [Microbacterium sp. BWT-B31]|uniref:hypothetical protein n=1 Tax=Microbacterium sp. BWT-B31 TaxID=3232072 RepID=UPI0035274BDD